MRKVSLSTIATVAAGQGAPKPNEFSDSGIPFVRAGSLADLLSGKKEADLELVPAETAKKRKLKLYPKGSILFAKSGMSATKDRIYVLQNPAHVVSHLAILTPKDNVHPNYLQLALKQFPPSILIKDPAYPAIGLGEIEDYKIPVPGEIDDQIRIAHLLGKVEGLIAQRKQHLQQLDDLLKSVFLKTFDDHVANEKNHKISTLAPYITHLTSGGRGWAKYYAPSGKRFIRSFDVQMNTIGSDDVVYVTPPNNKETERTRVLPGDVLLTITGSKIGRVCFVPQDFEEAYISQHVAIIRTNGINPIYLSFYLSMPTCGQRIIAKQQYGQAKPGLNLTQIQNFEIIVPDITLQNQFAAIVKKVEGLSSRYQQSLTDLENLYGALSQEAFKGELDLSRVPLPVEGTTEDTESTEEVTQERHETHEVEKTFELPTPVDLTTLKASEGRKALLDQWLAAWLEHRSDTPFAAQPFMEAARQRLWELAEDDAPEWGPARYDELKTWVFESLEQGRLTQSYDDAHNRVKITAAKG